MAPLIIEPATLEEMEPALQLLFQYVPDSQRPAAVARAREMFATELDPGGLLVARRGGELAGATLVNLAPGAVGFVWPPQAQAGSEREALEDALVQTAISWLRSRGTRMAQALLPVADISLGLPLERHGFAHVTRLEFMRRALVPRTDDLPMLLNLTFESYRPDTQECFETTLLRTYHGTQDCPELNDVRSLDEIIAGHRAQGAFDPRRWWLAMGDGEPVGVLLTNLIPESGAWELVYMGIVAEARGRGFGAQLVGKALTEASQAGAPELTLSVDGRNLFAQRIYRRLGFELWDEREVFLNILSAANRSADSSSNLPTL